MHLITGKSGTNHITSSNDGFKHSQIFGSGSYVFKDSDGFSARIIDNNTIEIGRGKGIHQGRLFEMEASENVSIENGATGYQRVDLIVARYEKNQNTELESIKLVTITGQRSASNPLTPQHIVGNIFNGDITADFPLYLVFVNGIVIESVTALFELNASIFNEVKINSIDAEDLKDISTKGSYNLIPFPYTVKDKYVTGIEVKVLEHGEMVLNGTSNASGGDFNIVPWFLPILWLPAGTYRLTCLPYEMAYDYLDCVVKDASGTIIANDHGKGAEFTLTEGKRVGVELRTGPAGKVYNNVMVKPFLVAKRADGTYPEEFIRGYADSLGNLYDGIRLINETLFSGSNNLVPFPYGDILPQTKNGLTFFTDGHGIIYVTGTASNDTEFYILLREREYYIPAGTYRFSCVPYHSTLDTVYVALGDGVNRIYTDVGWGGVFTVAQPTRIAITIRIAQGQTFNNTAFAPFLAKFRGDYTYPKEKEYTRGSIKSLIELQNEVEREFKIDENGSPNLIPFPYSGNDYSGYGITWQTSADGGIKAIGTASVDNYYALIQQNVTLEAGQYFFRALYGVTGSNDLCARLGDGVNNIAKDVGEGAWFTLYNTTTITAILFVKAGVAVDTTFYPMLYKRDSSKVFNGNYVRGGIMNNKDITDNLRKINELLNIVNVSVLSNDEEEDK